MSRNTITTVRCDLCDEPQPDVPANQWPAIVVREWDAKGMVEVSLDVCQRCRERLPIGLLVSRAREMAVKLGLR